MTVATLTLIGATSCTDEPTGQAAPPSAPPSLSASPSVNVDEAQAREKVLAAYNAGAPRVERWSGRTGVTEAETFVERIPYPETRDYVRIVLRNQEFYRALYPWEPASPTPSPSPRPR